MNQRYGNPYLFLNRAIKKKAVNRAISEILIRHDEGMRWSLYLACVANPFSDAASQSFEEFTQCVKDPHHSAAKIGEEIGMSRNQVFRQLQNSDQILHGFVPEIKGGEHT